jgi:hypothetical protein
VNPKFAHLIRLGLALLILLAVAATGYWQYVERLANPRIARELRAEPSGERAKRVMLLELPSGRQIPVNYFREHDIVHAAADGRWWSELAEGHHSVEVLVQGDELRGAARAILNDPERTREVFLRLRPNALEGFGVLIEITLEPTTEDSRIKQVP